MTKVEDFTVLPSAVLFDKLYYFYNHWPPSNRPEDVEVIILHTKRIAAIERELRFRHWFRRPEIHGPEHPYYRGRCVCRNADFPSQPNVSGEEDS